MSLAESRSLSRSQVSSGRQGLPEEVKSKANSLILLLYTVSIVWPIKFQLGPVYITVSRFLIIILLVPMLARLFSGRNGEIKTPDITVILFCMWSFIALSVNHGPGEVLEKSVMFFVETTGAYLIGRIFIRSREDFFLFIKYLLVAAMISIPFVIIELRTGQPVVLEALRKANPASDVFVLPRNINYETRMGMHRSQFTLSHPIFYGVFCASLMALALTVRTQGMNVIAKFFWGGVVCITTFASLSSGAFLSVLIQWMILIFEWVTRAIKARWKLVGVAIVLIYIILDVFSNNSPIAVFVTIFSFNPATAYNRLQIFEYGSAEVLRNPIFGIGNNDWIRPQFMSVSVDNHWLLDFMRYGFPGGLLLMMTVLWTLITVGRAPTAHSEDLKIAQRGYMAAMIGWCISLGTVAIGVEVFSYFMTLLAAGHWITDTANETAPQGGDSRDRTRSRGKAKSRETRSERPKHSNNSNSRVPEITRDADETTSAGKRPKRTRMSQRRATRGTQSTRRR